MRITKKLDKVVDKYLEIWYCVLNRECFNSKLPKKLEVKSARIKGLRGVTVSQGTKLLGIAVDPRDAQLVSVLLHEMCHGYQTHVLGYTEKHPHHDHAFWQLLKVAQRRLDLAIDTIHFPE